VSLVTEDVDLESDRRLVERCRSGEPDAFGGLYERYHPRLARHCARRLGSRANAEDVAQEAFIRAWRAIDRFEVGRPFYPWLQVIATHACTDALRRQRPTTSLSELGGAAEYDPRPGVEEQLTRSIDVELATGAMQRLTERHRRVLHLREELDWSVRDIAVHEGLEANAVDTLLWRARASLRRQFLALSEGVAAVVSVGGTRLVLVRHRLGRVLHRLAGAWEPALRARAVVATVVVVAVGASAASSTWAPAARPLPVQRGHHPSTLTSGAGEGPGTGTGASGAGLPHAVTGPVVGSSPTSSTSVRSAPARSGTGSAASAGPPASGSTVSTGGPNPGGAPAGGGAVASLPVPATAGQVVSGTVQAASGVVQTVTGSVTGAVGRVGATVGGALTATPAGPVLSPVVQSVNGATTAVGTTVDTGTDVLGTLGGLGGR